MDAINFRAYFMNMYVYWLIALAAISTTLIFITFDISRESRFMYSSLTMGAEVYLGLFLNRFEPEFIKLHDNQFEISYINFRSFVKPYAIYNKSEVKVGNKGDMLVISSNDKVIANIRKGALSAEDWTKANDYFC
jgi:hypothetical protein